MGDWSRHSPILDLWSQGYPLQILPCFAEATSEAEGEAKWAPLGWGFLYHESSVNP
jgi:hypothetical protein